MPPKPNKHFAAELAAHTTAWRRGTPEYAKRTGWPNPGAPPPCDERSCANYRRPQRTVPRDTTWLCDGCTAAVPLLRHFHTHAPSKMEMPTDKQRAHAAACFVVVLKLRGRAARSVGAPATAIALEP